ncbi:MAG: FtsX-like permease family protein, partial [Spirochaetota bacterium]|nr:FtsX-like permease family protein [Spirochaetota bacterium]
AIPYVQGQGLIRFQTYISPVVIRGIESRNRLPEDISKFITKGAKIFKRTNEVYIGAEMAYNYSIKIGNIIELIVPMGRLNAVTGITPATKKYKVIGFFKTGYYDFDNGLIIMSIPAAQKLYNIGKTIRGIGIKIDDVFKMDYTASQIQSVIGYDFQTLTAEQRNQNLFYALKLEKLIITIILFLIIISAGFTILGTLVMVVMEKRKSIGILKSMGAKPMSIMTIFVMEGFFIGLTGTFLGVIFGLAASLNLESIINWIENTINSVMGYIYYLFKLGSFLRISLVPKHVYYLDNIPTEINPEFIVFVAIIAVFLSTAATIFPAWNASRQLPAETIRYE